MGISVSKEGEKSINKTTKDWLHYFLFYNINGLLQQAAFSTLRKYLKIHSLPNSQIIKWGKQIIYSILGTFC